MIRFKLREEAHGYSVEGLDEASEVFANFVNFEAFGTWGVEQILAEVQGILSGSSPAVHVQRNTYLMVADAETFQVSFRKELGECATADFVTFLAEILAMLEDLPDRP